MKRTSKATAAAAAAAKAKAEKPPTNEFGEIVLNDTTLELSKVPTTEVDVSALQNGDEKAPVAENETSDETGSDGEDETSSAEQTTEDEDVATEEMLKAKHSGLERMRRLFVTIRHYNECKAKGEPEVSDEEIERLSASYAELAKQYPELDTVLNKITIEISSDDPTPDVTIQTAVTQFFANRAEDTEVIEGNDPEPHLLVDPVENDTKRVVVLGAGTGIGLSAAMMKIATGETPIVQQGVTKALVVDGQTNPTALRVSKEETALLNRLQPKQVRIANYDAKDDASAASVDVICGRISRHFEYILGERGFANEKAKEEQVVTFADQLFRLTRLSENSFYKVMDHIMSTLREHDDKLTTTTMFRFNICTARSHAALVARHNDFLNVCYKFAHNYAERDTLMEQVDFNKVCGGRTVKEAEMFKSYFRKFAHN